jgi:hypothetical protein
LYEEALRKEIIDVWVVAATDALIESIEYLGPRKTRGPSRNWPTDADFKTMAVVFVVFRDSNDTGMDGFLKFGAVSVPAFRTI